MKELHISSLEDMKYLATKIGHSLQTPPNTLTLLLEGDLGAGKTTFTKFLADAMGCQDWVNSPTYTIIQHYQCPEIKLVHTDLYRIQNESEIELLDLFHYIKDPQILCVIEWANKLGSLLPNHYLKIDCQLQDQTHRQLKLTASGESAIALMHTL